MRSASIAKNALKLRKSENPRINQKLELFLSMNKHLRLAFIIAPLLLVGGFIAAEYYSKYTNSQKKYHQLTVQGKCDIFHAECQLNGAGLELKITDKNGTTQLKSNHPLSTAAIAVVDNDKEKPSNLQADDTRQSWIINTARYASPKDIMSNKIRLIVSVDDEFFFSEFTSSN